MHDNNLLGYDREKEMLKQIYKKKNIIYMFVKDVCSVADPDRAAII